jgi:hypothetical protein
MEKEKFPPLLLFKLLLCLSFIVFLSHTSFLEKWEKFFLLFSFLFSFFLQSKWKKKTEALTLIFSLEILCAHYVKLPNHFFMMTYLLALVVMLSFLSFSQKKRKEIFEYNIRTLYFLLMFFAALQKMGGNFYSAMAYKLFQGNKTFLFNFPFFHYPEKILKQNEKVIDGLLYAQSLSFEPVSVQWPFSFFPSLLQFIVVGGIVGEVLLSLLVLFPRYNFVFHILNITFLLATFLLTKESLFLGIVGLMGYSLLGKKQHHFAGIYMVVILSFFCFSFLEIFNSW